LEEKSSRSRTLILDSSATDATRLAVVETFSFWGPLDQNTGYAPAFLQQIIPRAPVGIDAPVSLEPVDALAQHFQDRNLGILLAAELLNLASNSLGYGSVEYVEVRERYREQGIATQTLTDIGGNITFRPGDVTREFVLLESRLKMSFTLTTTLLADPDGLAGQQHVTATSQYIHPDHHWDSYQSFSRFDYHSELQLWEWGKYGAASFFGNSSVGMFHPWPDERQRLHALWMGDGEPRVIWYSAELQKHPEAGPRPMTPARSLLLSAAPLISQLQNPVQVAGGKSLPLNRVLEDRVERKLRGAQADYYRAVIGKLRDDGASLFAVGERLNGARALLEAFARLALPESFEKNDALRGFFLGYEPLPDAAEVVRLCSKGILLTQNSVDYRDRIRFDDIMSQRLAALGAVITNRLNEIELSGKTETLPLLADTLNRINEVQSLIEAPPPTPLAPALELLSATLGEVVVQLSGENGAAYGLQYSTNLTTWTDLPGRFLSGQYGTVTANGNNPLFVRARVIP
jgi:hypothetical protein